MGRPSDGPEEVRTQFFHRYTVDAYIVGTEPYPCIICGGPRQAAVHQPPDEENP